MRSAIDFKASLDTMDMPGNQRGNLVGVRRDPEIRRAVDRHGLRSADAFANMRSERPHRRMTAAADREQSRNFDCPE